MRKNYLTPQSADDYWEKYWAKVRVEEELEWLQLYYNLGAITSFLPAEGRVLECGCGTGRFLFQFTTIGRTMIGMDLVESPLHRIKAVRPSIPLVRGEVTSLPFRSNSFDGLMALGVLSWLPELNQIDQAMAEIVRVCKPGARLIISFPGDNLSLYWARFKKVCGRSRLLRKLLRKKSQEQSGAAPDQVKRHSGYLLSCPDLHTLLRRHRIAVYELRPEWPHMGLWGVFPSLRSAESKRLAEERPLEFFMRGRDGVTAYEFNALGRFVMSAVHPYSAWLFSLGIMALGEVRKVDPDR